MKKKTTYKFTLFLDGMQTIDEKVENALYDADCSDGMIGLQNGTVFIDFVRKDFALVHAVVSAIKQIENALKDVRIVGIEPSPFVTQIELAKEMNVSREYVRLLTAGKRGKGNFPSPVLSSEKRLYWELSSVLEWMLENKEQAGSQLQDAKDLSSLFMAIDIRRNHVQYQKALEILNDIGSP